MTNELKCVGRIEPSVLETLYTELQKYVTPRDRFVSIYGNVSNIPLLTELEQQVNALTTKVGLPNVSQSGWIGKISHTDGDSGPWHIDMKGSDPIGVVITSFPYPTQIYTGKETDLKTLLVANPCDDEIFVPQLGELWWMPAGTIHRSNPKSTGMHMALRWHDIGVNI